LTDHLFFPPQLKGTVLFGDAGRDIISAYSGTECQHSFFCRISVVAFFRHIGLDEREVTPSGPRLVSAAPPSGRRASSHFFFPAPTADGNTFSFPSGHSSWRWSSSGPSSSIDDRYWPRVGSPSSNKDGPGGFLPPFFLIGLYSRGLSKFLPLSFTGWAEEMADMSAPFSFLPKSSMLTHSASLFLFWRSRADQKGQAPLFIRLKLRRLVFSFSQFRGHMGHPFSVEGVFSEFLSFFVPLLHAPLLSSAPFFPF